MFKFCHIPWERNTLADSRPFGIYRTAASTFHCFVSIAKTISSSEKNKKLVHNLQRSKKMNLTQYMQGMKCEMGTLGCNLNWSSYIQKDTSKTLADLKALVALIPNSLGDLKKNWHNKLIGWRKSIVKSQKHKHSFSIAVLN